MSIHGDTYGDVSEIRLSADTPGPMSSSQAPRMFSSRLSTQLARVVLLLLAATLPPAAAQTTGTPRTQTVHLEAGPNLVSLDVVPAQTDLASLFGDALSQILLVKDGDGHMFAPSYGSPTLTHWAWDQAYLVHARQAADVTVTGASLSPESSLALEAGWNTVPYFLQAPTPVPTALASILDRVSRVEDGDGRVWPAVNGTPELTTLVPGQGYRIHLNAAATLVYAPPPPPLPGSDRTVNTLADALALPDLVVGQTIDIRGYHTPDDGGGGRFVVSDGNQRPDGGTVFVPEVALSGPLTHTQTDANNPDYEYGPELPAGVYAPHRDWTMVYTPSSGAGPFTINAWEHLAAHSYASNGHLNPGYDAQGPGRITYRLAERYGAGTWTLTYRQTTSSLRLVRQNVGSELNVRWFGARAENEAPNPSDVTIGSDYDAQVAITWAINLAQRRNDPAYGGTPGTITTIRVPGPATYRFAGPIELIDGLTLAGDGGVATVDATTTVQGAPGVPEADVSAQLSAAGYASGIEHPWAGYRTTPGGAPMPETPGSIARWSHQNGVLTLHYRPARIVAAPTRLRLFDGIVTLGVRMTADASHPDALPADVNYFVGKYQTSVTASSSPRANGGTPTSGTGDGPDVMMIGVRDLVLDGNHEGNREIWTEGRFGYDGTNAPVEFETWMRNSPSWGGICVSNHGSKRIPVGQRIVLRGVAVLGFGSNGLLGNPNNIWDGEAVLIGNSLWNHTLYGANGRFRDLTVTGFAWTHLASTANDIENLVYEGTQAAPYRGGALLGQRGFDVFDNNDYPGTGYGILPTGQPGGFRVNGYIVDGRGPNSPAFALGAGAGPDTHFEGAVLLRDQEGNLGVYRENHNGYYRGLWSGNRFDRVLSTRAYGGDNNGLVTSGPFQGLVSSDHVELQVDADRGDGNGHYAAPLQLAAGWSDTARGPGAGPAAGTNPWDNQVVQVVDGLQMGTMTSAILSFTNQYLHASGPGSPGFQPDPYAHDFDARSGGSRMFVLNARFRNESNSLVRGPGVDEPASGAERHIEFFLRDVEMLLHDYGMSRSPSLARFAYLDRVTFRGGPADREPGRIYRSEDNGTATAAGGETTLDIPTALYSKPVDPWTVGDRSFSGGRLTFSGSAASAVVSTEWVRRTPEPVFWDDNRAPTLRVTFSRPLAAGETLDWEAAVRPWPADVTVPAH